MGQRRFHMRITLACDIVTLLFNSLCLTNKMWFKMSGVTPCYTPMLDSKASIVDWCHTILHFLSDIADESEGEINPRTVVVVESGKDKWITLFNSVSHSVNTVVHLRLKVGGALLQHCSSL